MGERSGLPDLVALYPDGETARRVIERLSRAGVDGGAIELLGPVEAVSDGRYGDRQTDLGSSLALGGRLVRSLGWGMVPGAIFGAVVLSISTEPNLVVIAWGAGGGAIFGGGIGVLTGLLSIPTMARSWERTFAPLVPGGIMVGVRVDKERTDRRARRVLREESRSFTEVEDLDLLPEATGPSVRPYERRRNGPDTSWQRGPS